MIKVKKSVAILVIAFLILSNVAFAQYSDPSSYEGRPIDPSKEGKEYYKEGNIIVYTAQTSSQEKETMERFTRGEFSEEEMRSMAKAKLGGKFSEEEFKRGIMESKKRMNRKETFSYEHGGFEQRYYVGPSYEGYSKEHMVFALIFEHIGDEIDPREIKESCDEPEKIADKVIIKLKEKVGDLQSLCKQAEEQEAKCNEMSKKTCSQIGTPYAREGASELEKIQAVAYACPVNKDAIVEACKKRSKLQLEQQTKQSSESCERMFEYQGERLLEECRRFKENQICGKDKYIERCMGGIKKEDYGDREESGGKGFISASWQCYDGLSESHTDSSCKSSEAWQEMARKSCENRCYADGSKCGVNSFSVSGECKEVSKPICPPYTVPACGEGMSLKVKVDSNGCTYHYCEAVQPECLQVSQPSCAEGTTLQKRIDEKGCVSYYCEAATTNVCPTSTVPSCGEGYTLQKKADERDCVSYYCQAAAICPEAIMPSCGSGQALQKKTDDKGCMYYHCETTCPSVTKPICATDEILQTYYDNARCVTSYQCIKQTTTCQTVTKPSCAEGQSLTTKYDEKGCIIGYECITITSTNTSSVTGYAVLSTYDDLLKQCEKSWKQQEMGCSEVSESCDKDALIDKCIKQSEKNLEEYKLKIEQQCNTYSSTEIRAAEDRCSRMDKERNRCLEESAKRCEHMKGVAEKCRETLTEENVRNFIVEEAKKRCKFTGIIAEEEDVRKSDKVEIVLAILNTATKADIEKLELFVDDLKEDLELQDTTVYRGMVNPNNFGDIKLLPFVVNAKISAVPSAEMAKEVKANIVARQKVKEAAGKLASLRDSDVPSEYLYIIEDKASDVLDVSDELEDIEKKERQKGIGYKIRLFLGLAKAAEQEEIKQLDESKGKLKSSIDVLTKLIEDVPSDVAKAILKEQVESLKKQQEEIEILIEAKEKKSKGLLGLFG